MRSKNILSIAAFIIAFGFSSALALVFVGPSEYRAVSAAPGFKQTSYFSNRYKSATADAITALVRQDVSNGYRRDVKISVLAENYRPPFTSRSLDQYASLTEDYVDASSAMNADQLPADFQAAWNKHLRAWRDYSDFLNNVSDYSPQEKAATDKLNKLDDQYGAKINSTYYEVLQIGAKYGADVY